jgi:hypothetical protein
MSKLKRIFKKTASEIVSYFSGKTGSEEIVLEWSALNFGMQISGINEAEKKAKRITIMRMQRAKDPIGYLVKCFEILTKIKLYKSQKQELKKILNTNLNAFGYNLIEQWVRQSGKTELGAVSMIGQMVFFPLLAIDSWWIERFPEVKRFERGFLAVSTGPVTDQAQIPYRRMRKFFRKIKNHLDFLGIELYVNEKRSAELSNGSEIHCLSAFKTTAKEGEPAHYIHYEESQDISEYQINKVFEPMTAATQGMSVFNGTAGIRDCYFRRLCNAGGQFFYKHTIEKAIDDNPRYTHFVDKYIQQHGINSIYVRTNLFLEFVLKFGMLITDERYRKLVADGLNKRPAFGPGEYTPGSIRFAGIDWGKYDSNTVVSAGELAREHKRLIELLILEGTDYREQLTIIIPWLKERNIEIIHCDSTGTQDQILDMLKPYFLRVFGIVYSPVMKFELLKLFRIHMPFEKSEMTDEKQRLMLAGRDFLRFTQFEERSDKSKLFVPNYPPDHPDWRRFEEELLNCETEKKGNVEVFHKPEKRDREPGLAEIKDDCVSAFFNMLHAGEEASYYQRVPRRYEVMERW